MPQKKSTGEWTRLSLSQLLQRPCICKRRICYQQFAECEDLVLAARRSFQDLEPSQRVSCHLCRVDFSSYFILFFQTSKIDEIFIWPLVSSKVAALNKFLKAPNPDSVQLENTICAIQKPSDSSISKPGSSSLALDFFSSSDEEHGFKSDAQSEISGAAEQFMSSDDDMPRKSSAANLALVEQDVCNDEGAVLYSSDDVGMDTSDEEDCPQREASSAHSKPVPSKRRPAGSAEFLRKHVCWSALRRLLGVGDSTLQKLRSGQQAYAGRPKRPKHPVFGFCIDDATSKKWHGVVTFLWFTYHSCAEFMPNHLRSSGSKDEAPFPSNDEDTEDFSQRYVSKALMELNVYSSDINVMHMGPDSDKAPKRYLQHSSRTELFWEYTAYCIASGQEAASLSTFMRVTNCVLKPGMRGSALAFRKVNEHGQCDTCWKLKLSIKQSKSETDREANFSAYLKHVTSQWMDRQVYWHHRSQSQAFFQKVVEMGTKFLGPAIS